MTTTNEIPAGALYGTPAERITRPNDGETIETRLGRLEARTDRIEAWMRNEIFARTAMDEPDPDTGEDDPWGEFSEYVESESKNHASTWITSGKRIVTKAIELGLAVSPDDPRLQPLTVTDDLCRVICNTLGWNPKHTERNLIAFHLARDVVAHLNAAREVER